MNGPQVEVIAYTTFISPPPAARPRGDQDVGTDAARLIETAGRVCYDSWGKGRSSSEFHQHLREVGHLSVIEHASLTFFITNISRSCSHELVRHRIGASPSQRSGRYCDESEREWIWHPLLDPALIGELVWRDLTAFEDEARRLYGVIAGAVEQSLIEERGMSPVAARKQARSAARGVLGNALSTELVWTANLRALRHFLELRATDHADAEIRLLANRLYEAAQPYCPEWLQYNQRDAADGIGYVLEAP